MGAVHRPALCYISDFVQALVRPKETGAALRGPR